MKMRRFCTKNEIPCHQHGKQSLVDTLTASVVFMAPVVTRSVTFPVGGSGVVEVVTAAMAEGIDDVSLPTAQSQLLKNRTQIEDIDFIVPSLPTWEEEGVTM